MPNPLSTRFLLDEDLGKAAREVIANVHRLIQAGYFNAAYRLTTALSTPGPWKVSNASHSAHALSRIVLWLSAVLGRDCPALGPAPSRTAGEAREWLKARNFRAVIALTDQPDLVVQRVWSGAQVAHLLEGMRPGALGDAFVRFKADVDSELRLRIRARSPNKAVDGTVSSSAQFALLSHQELADAVEHGAMQAFDDRGVEFSASVSLLAAALDLLDGAESAAIERLSRVLPLAPPEADEELRTWPRYIELLRRHELAPSLAISEATVQAYLQEFRTRKSASNRGPTLGISWKERLKTFVAREEARGVDSDDLIDALELASPSCPELIRLARRGQLINKPAKAEEIESLEARLGAALPPSYREFLLASNGMIVPGMRALLPAHRIDWLSRSDPQTIESWCSGGGEEASDEQYGTYGVDQDCVHMRTRHLNAALSISNSLDGDLWLLIADVRFGEEWEAWFLGAKNPGAFRYRSFREMAEQYFLAGD